MDADDLVMALVNDGLCWLAGGALRSQFTG